MIIRATVLPGVHLIERNPRTDQRGAFVRQFCRAEFAEAGLASEIVQCNISRNHRRGTLRGMHYQDAPHEEAKLVSCTSGAIYDVALDLRPASPTRHLWLAVELSREGDEQLYLPAGVAHGFQTLRDDTEVFYQMFAAYHPESARGVRYDDPAFAIDWPLTPSEISERDRGYPLIEQDAVRA